MSHCRSVQIEGLAYSQAAGRQRATQQRAVWRASLSTTQREMYQISHHIFPILIHFLTIMLIFIKKLAHLGACSFKE
jgi:hypothetical protein